MHESLRAAVPQVPSCCHFAAEHRSGEHADPLINRQLAFARYAAGRLSWHQACISLRRRSRAHEH